MTAVAMAFMLLCGAVLQAVIPSSAWLGEARVPVLLACVVYYAFTRPQAAALRVAFLAGLLQDGLCMIPLGYSSFCFCLVTFVINRVRGEVFVHEWATRALFGALAGVAATAILYILLTHGGLLKMPLAKVVLKAAGVFLLGGVAMPIVFKIMESVEKKLGLLEVREVS